MRYLRKLRGRGLAAWALLVLCWFAPSVASAAVPQAPTQNTNLSLSAKTDNALDMNGRLQSNGQPVAGAQIFLSLDNQLIKQVTTGTDGSYSSSVGLPSPGDHVVTATFGGDKTYRAAAAQQRVTVRGGPATTAPPAPAAASTITATLSPNPVHAGDVLMVAGTLTSNGAPIDAARVDILCDFGGLTAMGATDATGAFSAPLSLPATGQPATLTVTITYAGDGRFPAARGTFKASVTAATTPTPVPTPSIAPSSNLPSISQVTASHDTGTAIASATRRDAATPASTAGFFLGAVALYAFASLFVVWVLAWRRHELLPGERRGFGSDFGRRRSA